ncbi:division/cell wall cluster transcriptional repressor MraZ [Actibacterium pelagium]|uniref:Transcriptional regulator MraZ n=1 Tax=Actibacterium pelagium TaxID=2029103 RepID=A0A917EI83_9RHOB|nr:division/cell wall cluster transcriptional repressor MraZ [Actibacterium pelagium]GGE47434.1 transcriptional regulator MraZ [Actibacterium pelagium]
MARRFRGEYTFKVDAKGRMSIPALFRRVLEAGDPNWTEGLRPELVIVYGDDSRDFLEVYTMTAIDALDDKIARLPRSPLKRRLERMISGQSHQTEVDGDGRLVLPQKLRQKIGLEKEAFFIASGDTFQIWKPETFEAEDAAFAEELGEDIPEGTDPLDALDLMLDQREDF